MSCQIRLISRITDVEAIKRCLFPTDDLRGSDSWLQTCELSVSPVGDIIAIANERRLVILTVKWEEGSPTSQYQITFSGSVHESDNIKAVLCFPIARQTKSSSHAVPEWTCVMLGFESGFVRFYTENFELLFEEQLHNEIVNSIKCQSQHNPRPEMTPNLFNEEIYVQYQNSICVLSGEQLLPILRNRRGELNRARSKGDQTWDPASSAQPINLSPKKWGIQEQTTINDTAVVGLSLPGEFNRLLVTSTYGGFDSRYQYSSLSNLVVAAGSQPFLGFHYARVGLTMPQLSDVAKVVANKLKSALPGWLGGGSSEASHEKVSIAMQPVDMMECRFGLCDLRRTTTDVVLSGDHRLAAVSDALGRVLLVDAWRGITLRIFKGYRDAQCAFVRVPDERHSKHRLGNKVATFLVIYSPKKGTLEMFTVQQGSKIATFSAAKYSRLVYNNYGLMGFTATYRSRHSCPITTVFIDNDGMIKEIMIPFHFALDYKNSKRARDIHLYKKLRQLLKYGDCDTDTLASETLSICTELQTTDLKLQTLEMLLADKSIPAEITLECLQCFLNNLGEGDEKMMESLRIMSENATILLKLYIFSTNGNKASIENKEQSDSANSENGSMVPDYGSTLSPERLSSLQKFVGLNSGNLRVEFDDLKNPSPSQYLSLFEIEHLDSIRLKTNVDDSLLYQVSEMIFKKYIVDNEKKLEELQEQILNCKIVPENLFQLLLHYWINRPNEAGANVLQHMNNLHGVVEILIKTISEEELIPTDNYPSQFWIKIRETLLNSPKLFPALTAAIVFKKLQQNLEISTSDLSIGLDDSVEVWSEEIILWSMLIINLEHVTPLEIILANKSSDQYCKLPKLEYDKFDISLKNILSKGKGSVSELVARWFTLGGVDPELIVINDELYRKAQNPDQSESFSDDGSDTVPKPEIPPHLIEAVEASSNFKHLNMMKEHFPYSLDASMILANMCWEYALAWQKDIDNLANLEACCTCLNRIPDAHIRKGLYKMVWNTHFKITFESACKVINKAGKIPTERLCRQGTGLSDTQIGTFLRITTNFLDTYLTAFQKADQSPKPTLKFENIWGEASQPLALVELALLQNEINYNLVHLHYQLSYTLELMAAFSIKHSKPINNLFEYYTLGMFFQDFQNEAKINWEYADGRTKASRIQFLHKVISHSIETISVDEKGKTHSGKHYDWMQRCLDIGVVWNIEKSVLKLYEVVQLYNHGFDDIGEFQIKCVYDTQKLGLELLDVACRRLSLFLATDPKITLNVPAFATDVTIYIKKYKGEWCAPSTLRRLEHLARHVVRCMDEEANEHEYKIAVLLLDGVETLRSLRRDVE